ncbi:MAG: NADPH-dependent FMN reductase [Deltaproteobacteria bacterium]
MKVLAIPGSTRAASTNRALLLGLSRIAEHPVSVTIYDGLRDLPIFSPDLEGAATPATVIAFAKAVHQADVLVISSPEYVRSIPGGLKNAIDWLVSRDELIAKPIALIHASHRGDDMLADLRRVLSTVSSNFLPDVFERFELVKISPDDIQTALSSPTEQLRLKTYLNHLLAKLT